MRSERTERVTLEHGAAGMTCFDVLPGTVAVLVPFYTDSACIDAAGHVLDGLVYVDHGKREGGGRRVFELCGGQTVHEAMAGADSGPAVG